MKKIKIEKYEGKSVDYITTETALKVNEIIDWVNAPDEAHDDLIKVEDRLKTLEDNFLSSREAIRCLNSDVRFNDKRIEFVMKNSMATPNTNKSLQDLWDEQNDTHKSDYVMPGFEDTMDKLDKLTIKPTVKEPMLRDKLKKF